MNKTISIALAGFSFVIEENAYIQLNDYLQALRASLDHNEADEVMYDIEIRVTEILRENLGKREVVNDEDVEKVIAQIGTPEVIEQQEEAYYSEQNQYQKHRRGEAKQLFRDASNAKIAGVCSGLAHYLGIDVTMMRIIWAGVFVLGIFSAGISSTLIGILYLIFWAAMPKAETASDFLKMKGKPMDFDHIKEESVRFASGYGQKAGEFYEKNKQRGANVWAFLRKALGFFLALFAVKFIGLGILIGLGFLGDPRFTGLREFDYIFSDQGYYKSLIEVLGVIAMLIPALICIAMSVKLFSPKTKVRYFFIAAGVLFLSLIGVSAYMGMKMSQENIIYTGHNSQEENIALSSQDQILYLDTKKIIIPQNFVGYGNELFSDKKKVWEQDHPDVYINRKPSVQQPYLVIKKTANGYNEPLRLNVPVEIKGNTILLPNYIGYSYQERFRDYEVRYELVLPTDFRVLNQGGATIDVEEADFYEYVYPKNTPDIHHKTPHEKTPTDSVEIKHQ